MTTANLTLDPKGTAGYARTWHISQAAGDHREEFARQLRLLSKVSYWRALAAVVFDWALIVTAFVCAVQFPYFVVWVLAAIVIASRQHGLLIVMHDASHHRLFPNRVWNDRLSDWLLAWPLVVSTEAYRRNHLAHHMHLNTDDDPDWVRKRGKPEWEFPKTRWGLLCLFVRDLCGGGMIDQFRALRTLSHDKASGEPVGRAGLVHRLAYYFLAAALIIGSGIWLPVALLWFLPAFTLLPMLLRFRSIAEHFGVEGTHELNSTRNAHCAWWERLLLEPHNVGFHLDHHLFPSVPFYNLPRLHTLLLAVPEYASLAHQSEMLFGSYDTSLLTEILVPLPRDEIR